MSPAIVPKVLVLHAHDDHGFADRLRRHLGRLRRPCVLAAYDDRDVAHGQEWAVGIRAELETADLVLLLVSPAFLGSPFPDAPELRPAVERHAAGDLSVVPIALRPCPSLRRRRQPRCP